MSTATIPKPRRRPQRGTLLKAALRWNEWEHRYQAQLGRFEEQGGSLAKLAALLGYGISSLQRVNAGDPPSQRLGQVLMAWTKSQEAK